MSLHSVIRSLEFDSSFVIRISSFGSWPFFAGIVLLLAGCASPVLNSGSKGLVIVVPGIAGDGPDYGGLCRGLADGGQRGRIETFDWGYPWPLMLVNLSSGNLHEAAEKKLAEYLTSLREKNPDEEIALIGHSAGAGVILGALPRLSFSVGPVILLAPAVSPDYDLKGALEHCRVLHVFYSEDDDFWQGLGPEIFGNYDGVHRSGAGRRGFTLIGLDESERKRVFQHAFAREWKEYGVYGGHFEWLRGAFGAEVLEPVIQDQRPTSGE